MCQCRKTKDIIEAEREVIKRHLDRHKWFRHINDENQAVIDFVWSYAWLMMECYCGKLCKESKRCEFGKTIPETLKDISDGELLVFIKKFKGEQPEDLSSVQLQVIKHHIGMHKWFHQMPNYDEAIYDFLERFGWVIEDMYKITKESQNQTE